MPSAWLYGRPAPGGGFILGEDGWLTAWSPAALHPLTQEWLDLLPLHGPNPAAQPRQPTISFYTLQTRPGF